MGYSRLSSRIIKGSNSSGVRHKKLEIIKPHIVLTKPVEKIKVKVKKNKKDTD